MTQKLMSGLAAVALAVALSGCAVGSANDPLSRPATMVPPTSTGIVLDKLPPPARPLDVAIYSFPDLTGQKRKTTISPNSRTP